MKKPIKDEERPICPCGKPMVLVEHEGCCDNFSYWDCSDPDCNLVNEFETDAECIDGFVFSKRGKKYSWYDKYLHSLKAGRGDSDGTK